MRIFSSNEYLMIEVCPIHVENEIKVMRSMNDELLKNVVQIETSPVSFDFVFALDLCSILTNESHEIIRLNTNVDPLKHKEHKEQSPEEQRKDWLRRRTK